MHHSAQKKIQDLQDKHREIEESLIGVLGQVIKHANTYDTNEALGHHVRNLLEKQGGTAVIADQFKLVTAYHDNNYYQLLWHFHANNRAVIFRVLDQIKINSSTQDQSLLQALDFVRQHRSTRKNYLPATIKLHFVSRRWQKFVYTKIDGQNMLERRALEVCVLSPNIS